MSVAGMEEENTAINVNQRWELSVFSGYGLVFR